MTGERKKVAKITKVERIALVEDPATTKSLAESEGGEGDLLEEEERPMDLNELKSKQLDLATTSPVEVFNCIFKDCTYNYQVAAWPEETSTRLGPEFVQRNNCYHGYTSFAYDGSTTKTCAEWSACAQVDDSGELDATDPLLADPGAGDFGLEAGSPCRRAGHGSGVTAAFFASDKVNGSANIFTYTDHDSEAHSVRLMNDRIETVEYFDGIWSVSMVLEVDTGS